MYYLVYVSGHSDSELVFKVDTFHSDSESDAIVPSFHDSLFYPAQQIVAQHTPR